MVETNDGRSLSGFLVDRDNQVTVLRDNWPVDLPEHVELADVPFFPQEDYQCGPAALATSLANFAPPPLWTRAAHPLYYGPEFLAKAA